MVLLLSELLVPAMRGSSLSAPNNGEKMTVQHNDNGSTFIPTDNVDKIIELPNRGSLIIHKTGQKTFSIQSFATVLKAYKNASKSSE